MKTRLLFCLIFFGLVFSFNRADAAPLTFNWTGTGTCSLPLVFGACLGTRLNTTDWNNADNWTGGIAGHLVPIAGDAVFIGVNTAVTNMPVIGVTGTAAYACASITFGYNGPQSPHSFGTISNLSLTINPGNSLTVTSVTQNLFPGINNNPYNYTNTTILGGGSLTCQTFTIGDATTAPGVLCQAVTRVSIQTPLFITGDLTLNSNGNGSTTQAAGWGICFPYFSVEKGTTQLKGQMKFAMHNSAELNGINLANSTKTSSYPGYGLVTADNTANSPSTFELQALIPIAKADNFYVFFTYGGNNGTVLYDAPSGTQTIYTANEPGSPLTTQSFINGKLPAGVTVIPSVPTGASASYYNLTFTGSAKAVDPNNTAVTGATAAPTLGLTVGGALLNNSGSTLNCGTATPVFYGNYTNSGTFTPGTSTTFFSGTTAQALLDNSTAGTKFKNVTFNGGGTKSMSGSGATYPFSVSSTGVLTMAGNSLLTTGGVLTLISDAAGSANVDVIPTGSSITGNVNVQRYMSGGAGRRGYRLMSSPVYNTISFGSIKAYSLSSLQATTPITGWSATGLSYSATQPVNAFDNSPLGNPSAFFYYEPDKDPANRLISSSDYKALNAIGDYLPLGNGFLFFFRGSRSTVTNPNMFLTTGSPDNTTLNNAGALNQGDISVYIPTAVGTSGSHTVYTAAAAGGSLSTTFSKTTTTTPNTDGFHLVGNPYACTIDLEEALKAANFTNQPTGNNYIYALNNSGAFGSYLLVGGTPAGGITRWIASGQGFFIKTSGSSTLTFHEACKVTTGYTLPTSFAVAQNNNAPSQVLHVNLMLDSANANETVVQFGYRHASNKFFADEDAGYVTGPLQTTYLTSYSSDNKPCLINQMNTLDSVNSITLYAGGPKSGRYTLSFSGAETLDSRYKIFLKDSFKKDSLDLSGNTTYQFDLDLSNPKTFGDTRFSLVVHPTHIQDLYQLTTFSGTKFNNSVQLNWKAAHEGYYTDFKVQRSIDGGKTFATIGDVQSDASGTYGFADTNPALSGTNQYRIFQTVDSTVTKTSGIVTVTYTSEVEVVPTNILKVYPNPATTTLNVVIKTNEAGGPLVMRIYNMKSQLVLSNNFSKDSTLSMDVSKLLTGAYVIHVTDNNKDYGSVTFTKF